MGRPEDRFSSSESRSDWSPREIHARSKDSSSPRSSGDEKSSGWELLVELLPAGRLQQIATLFKTMMRAALRNIHERCSQNAIAIFDIFPLVQIGYRHRIIQTPPNLQADVESVFGCLKFKLKFESTIVAVAAQWFHHGSARRRDHAAWSILGDRRGAQDYGRGKH